MSTLPTEHTERLRIERQAVETFYRLTLDAKALGVFASSVRR